MPDARYLGSEYGGSSGQQELLLASIQILRISFVLVAWKLDSVIGHVFFHA
jgi:hypothetical protein